LITAAAVQKNDSLRRLFTSAAPPAFLSSSFEPHTCQTGQLLKKPPRADVRIRTLVPHYLFSDLRKLYVSTNL